MMDLNNQNQPDAAGGLALLPDSEFPDWSGVKPHPPMSMEEMHRRSERLRKMPGPKMKRQAPEDYCPVEFVWKG
jgi:hypothetical protein